MVIVDSELNNHYYLSDVNDVILLLSLYGFLLKRLKSMVYIVATFLLNELNRPILLNPIVYTGSRKICFLHFDNIIYIYLYKKIRPSSTNTI